MTHDELLAEIIGEGDGEIVKSTRRWNNTKALRAVVELHNPNMDGNCHHCWNPGTNYLEPYPCITIQAIEKELQ